MTKTRNFDIISTFEYNLVFVHSSRGGSRTEPCGSYASIYAANKALQRRYYILQYAQDWDDGAWTSLQGIDGGPLLNTKIGAREQTFLLKIDKCSIPEGGAAVYVACTWDDAMDKGLGNAAARDEIVDRLIADVYDDALAKSLDHAEARE